ncbi:MAG TPA: DUF2007 domain-containing protein [Burkholderiaceae bacterium]|nr:DUF2007 domain-containing protein [Burkholderiaceae bacterium]
MRADRPLAGRRGIALKLLVQIDHVRAYLLRDRLAQHGIKVHVFNENMQGVAGGVPTDVAMPQVWLDDERDRPRADALLRDFLATPDVAGSVFCRGCHQENPANFELCWSCGRSL